MTKIEQQIEEGKRRAAERRAMLTPEQLVKADQAGAILLDRMSRMFAGTEQMCDSKGHFPCMIATRDECIEFFLRGL